ncbi:MAG: BrnT family toxin [Candidatus Sulfotelmatobacter sp.]
MVLIGIEVTVRSAKSTGFPIPLIESLFADPLAVIPDTVCSHTERRFCATGKTGQGRSVFIVFTLRRRGDEQFIRPISACYMRKKEIETYEKENPSL